MARLTGDDAPPRAEKPEPDPRRRASDEDRPADRRRKEPRASSRRPRGSRRTRSRSAVGPRAEPRPMPRRNETADCGRAARDDLDARRRAPSAHPPASRQPCEDPTHMPGPEDPGGRSRRPGPPPGPRPARRFAVAPQAATSSRSIYRSGTAVITRSGTVGTRGQWRVVEYPTSGLGRAMRTRRSAADSSSEGFSDYRE